MRRFAPTCRLTFDQLQCLIVEGAENPQRPIYTISAVARMLNVSTTTLRNWEERYGLVVPQRSPGGHRLYSLKQLDELRFLATQVQAGLQPGEAHRLLVERFGEGEPKRAALWRSPTEHPLILIVECSTHTAELCEHAFHARGYRVELVSDGADAQRVAAEMQPNLNIVELLVEGGMGPALCGRLRKQTQAPVLAVSSLRPVEEPRSFGADAFLQKPLDSELLVVTAGGLMAGDIGVSMSSQRL
jgi:DNA-binding transcriptional MerR regulator